MEDRLLKRVGESAYEAKTNIQHLGPKTRIPEVGIIELHEDVSEGHFGKHKTLEKTRGKVLCLGLETTVVEVLIKSIVRYFGVPLELYCDQIRNFQSILFTEMCVSLRFRKAGLDSLTPAF